MQGYGTVDCGGISATAWDDPPEVRLGTVGRPLDGNEIRIVDSGGQAVPPGETGRLLVRGLHTDARSFNNPDLNRERRRDGYFDVQEFVRMDAKGNLVLMGREQEIIIRGGQNIYPADVEAALVQHPKVLEVCAFGVHDAEMGERVCCSVVCRPGETLTVWEAARFLENAGLAEFKWHERIEVVKSLPRVASGHKIDRRKLKENFSSASPDSLGSLTIRAFL
jgi:non-ribosomal peptide synthetase component E (peptide arylation enzyme)